MSKLLNETEQLHDYDVFLFWDKEYEGSCPCFSGSKTENGKTVNVHGRCWRVSKNDQDLHVWGDHPDLKAIAEETKRALDETKWHNPYTIVYEELS